MCSISQPSGSTAHIVGCRKILKQVLAFDANVLFIAVVGQVLSGRKFLELFGPLALESFAGASILR